MQNKKGWGNAILCKSGIPYYGGKYAMVRHILPLIPPHTVYCEPFVGGGVVLLNKQRSNNELINDKEYKLIFLYYVIKSAPSEMAEYLSRLPNSQHVFYKFKETVPIITQDRVDNLLNSNIKPSEQDVIDAVKLLYLMGYSIQKHCETYYYSMKISDLDNGDLRSRPDKWIQTRMLNIIQNISEALTLCTITCTDALTLLPNCNTPYHFVYLDPPYLNTTPGANEAYRSFCKADMDKLVKWCKETPAKFLLSNFSQILDMYPELRNFNVEVIKKAKSKMGIMTSKKHKSDFADFKEEVLIYNYERPQRQLFE